FTCSACAIDSSFRPSFPTRRSSDLPPQPVITSDNLVVSIDTVLYFRVINPKDATYEISSFLQGIEQLTVTTLRNVIGSMDLERTDRKSTRLNSSHVNISYSIFCLRI